MKEGFGTRDYFQAVTVHFCSSWKEEQKQKGRGTEAQFIGAILSLAQGDEKNAVNRSVELLQCLSFFLTSSYEKKTRRNLQRKKKGKQRNCFSSWALCHKFVLVSCSGPFLRPIGSCFLVEKAKVFLRLGTPLPLRGQHLRRKHKTGEPNWAITFSMGRSFFRAALAVCLLAAVPAQVRCFLFFCAFFRQSYKMRPNHGAAQAFFSRINNTLSVLYFSLL